MTTARESTARQRDPGGARRVDLGRGGPSALWRGRAGGAVAAASVGALLVTSFVTVVAAAPVAVAAAGDQITGTIWHDYDSNGVLDSYESGIPGIEVRAYDADGAVAGPVVTGADGTYALPVTSDADRWRVEANVPDGTEWSQWRDAVVGRSGTVSNGTTVQTVDIADADGVDFSFQVPGAYVENDPLVYTPIMRFATLDGLDGGDAAGGSVLPYTAMSTCATCVVPTSASVRIDQLGSTNGSAWQRADAPGGTGTIFTAAYLRRHSALGPGGLGALYKITPDGADWSAATASAELYVDLTEHGIDVGSVDAPGAVAGDPNGLRPSVTSDNPAYAWDRDAQAWGKVGRVGLGGMAFTADERSLFVVNLHNRSLVRVDTGTPAVSQPTVSEIRLDSLLPAGSDLRPYGLSTDALTDTMYLTVTDTAESTQDPADLHGYVYAFSPDSPSDMTLVLDFPLGFDRGLNANALDRTFRPWGDAALEAAFDDRYALTRIMHNQAVLADAKVLHGNLVLGIRDLTGDILGAGGTFVSGDLANDDRLDWSASNGATYIAAPDGSGGWQIEDDGFSGGVRGAGATSGQRGPGGAAFFDTGWMDSGAEESLGSIVVIPSRDDGILTTGIHTGGGAWQVGIRRLFQETGTHVEPRGAVIRQDLPPPGPAPRITAKGNGLGSMSTLASAAPIEIGNYVWYDVDNDGIQDPDEDPVVGATVNLYAVDADGTRTLVSTTTTDARGEYYFSSDDAGYPLRTRTDYVVGIDNPADYAQGGPLYAWYPTVDHTGDPLSRDAALNDSNGVVPEGATDPFPYATVTTGGPGENDHSIDFGFSQVDYELTKRTVSGPDQSPDSDGTWTITYELVVENTGRIDGTYDLTDDLTGYGEGIEVAGTRVVSGPAGAPLNAAWDGDGDQRVVTSSVPIAAQSLEVDGAAHVYTLEVTVRLTADATTGAALADAEQLACLPDGAAPDAATTGLFNSATLDPSNHEEIVDDACGELPLVSLVKTVETEPAVVDRDGLPGTWEIVYGLTVTNETDVPTEYDLVDRLRFGSGVEVESVSVESSAPAGIVTNPSYDGIDDVTVVTDEPIAGGASHQYLVTVRYGFTLPEPPTEQDPSDCTLLDGSEEGTGLLNDAQSSFNGYPSVDTECRELGQVAHTKSLVSATPAGEGRWAVSYSIEVRNKGVAPTLYDLVDELRFAEGTDVVETTVTSPDGVVSTVDGSAPFTLATSTPILGTGDVGYAPHVHTVDVVVDVPLSFGEQADPLATCAVGGGAPGDQALTNTSRLTDEAGVTEDDVACAPLPSIDLTKTVVGDPVAGGDGTWTVEYDVTVTNTGGAEGVYDVTDRLRLGAGVVVEGARVASAPEGVAPLGTWTGRGAPDAEENVVATDVTLAAGGTHVYRVELVVSLDEDLATPESLTCPAPGSGADGGLANTAGLGHNDLTADDEACASLPQISITKEIVAGPVPVEGLTGVYAVDYALVVTNTGTGAGSYDLDDALRLSEGISVVGAPVVARTLDDAEPLNAGYDGIDDVRVVSGQRIAAAGPEGPVAHTYTVTVQYSIALGGEPGAVAVSACAAGADDAGTGVSNTAGVSWNGYGDQDDACFEVGQSALDKQLVSAQAVGEGRWEVVYDLTVSNLGSGATSYDLADELRFDPSTTVTATSVVGPDGVALVDGWDGAEQQQIAAGVVLLGAADDGYAPHVYTVRAVAEVPLAFPADGPVGSGPVCTSPEGLNLDRQALNNVATLTTDAGETAQDTACADLPEIEVVKTIDGDPDRAGDRTTTTYRLEVTNTGGAAGSYVLRDQLRYGAGLTVVDVTAENAAPGTVPVLGSFTGRGAQVSDAVNAITGEVVLDAGAQHVFEVVVVATLDASAATATSLQCAAAPGVGDRAGLLNVAVVEHNGLQADDDACAPVPPGGALPSTGAVVGLLSAAALLLVLLGVATVVVVRRRTVV